MAFFLAETGLDLRIRDFMGICRLRAIDAILEPFPPRFTIFCQVLSSTGAATPA